MPLPVSLISSMSYRHRPVPLFHRNLDFKNALICMHLLRECFRSLYPPVFKKVRLEKKLLSISMNGRIQMFLYASTYLRVH